MGCHARRITRIWVWYPVIVWAGEYKPVAYGIMIVGIVGIIVSMGAIGVIGIIGIIGIIGVIGWYS